MDGNREFTLPEPAVPGISPRRWIVALVLAAAGGLAGLHRLYLGRFVSGGLRLALAGAVFISVGGLDGFFGGGGRSPVNWYAGTVFLSGCAQLFFHVFSADFLSRGLLPFGKEARRELKYYPVTGKIRWVKAPRPLPPQWYSDAAPKALLAATLAVWHFIVPDGVDAGVEASFLVFMGGASLSGMLWAMDLLLIAYNRLTDSRGRVPQ